MFRNVAAPAYVPFAQARALFMARLIVVALGLLSLPALAAAELTAEKASDPVTLGWMVGTPPPLDKTIRFADGSFYRFPQMRWSFSHWRELFPTKVVARGQGLVSQLPKAAHEANLDDLTFKTLGDGREMTWARSPPANHTDGICRPH